MATQVENRPFEGPLVNDEVDRVERALMEASGLIELTMSLHHRQSSAVPAILHPPESALTDIADHLISEASFSLNCAILDAESRLFSALPVAAPDAASPVRQPPGSLQLQLLLGTEAGGDADFRDRLSAHAALGAAARIAPGAIQEMLIVDGRVALLTPRRYSMSRRITILRDPATVRAMDALFTGAWSHAQPLALYRTLNERLRDEPTRQVLDLLRRGMTDTAAARSLGITLRTYRRRVSFIMHELGVHSRFQAGVRATELGLFSQRRT